MKLGEGDLKVVDTSTSAFNFVETKRQLSGEEASEEVKVKRRIEDWVNVCEREETHTDVPPGQLGLSFMNGGLG